MSQPLPPRPNADHLRTQAKDLLSALRSGDPDARARFAESLPSFSVTIGKAIVLRDAQSVIAREYGFASWAKLMAHVESVRASQEGITDETTARFIQLALSEHTDRLRRLLELHPALPQARPECALVSGEIETVRRWLDADPDRLTAKLGPNDWPPLAYVCFSQMAKAFPERGAGLRDMVRLLLDRGADPIRLRSSRRRTIYACRCCMALAALSEISESRVCCWKRGRTRTMANRSSMPPNMTAARFSLCSLSSARI